MKVFPKFVVLTNYKIMPQSKLNFLLGYWNVLIIARSKSWSKNTKAISTPKALALGRTW